MPALLACSKQAPATPEEQAAEAAQGYYRALYADRVEAFLDGRQHAAAMPADYRRQLLDCYRQHVTQVNDQHRGVSHIEAARAQMDSTLGVMQVFLQLTYGDGTQEETVVPMTEGPDHHWLMK